MHKNDVLSLCSLLVGVASLASDATFGSVLDNLLPNHAAKTALGCLALLGIVAAQVIRTLSVPAGSTPSQNPTTAAPPQNGSQS